jgi:Fe-S-cluster-containing dehydrogenase component
MSMDRRTLLKGLAVAAPAAAAGSAGASEPVKAPDDAVGMLYDATRCIGCRACVTACKKANNLPLEMYDPPNDLNGTTKNIIKIYNEGDTTTYMKGQCMHCLDPACVRACMVGSFKKREFGIVTWDPSRCIGCRYCQVACPYNIPKFQWDTPVPKIVKCEMCVHLIKGGSQPGCCAACPKEAVIYGTYTDLLADARERVAKHPDRYWPKGDPQIFGDDDGGGTQVLYLAGVEFEKLGLPTLGPDPAGEIAQKVQHGVYQGFIAPVALYAVLGAVIWRNRRAEKKEEE